MKSPICPSTPHHDTPHTPHTMEDADKPLAVSMEEYWRGMEDKQEVENELKAKEKQDIGDLVQRIR